MEKIEFNLIREPWVRVMLPDCSIREVSLRDALLQAHQFKSLGGELPTQNVAVLRLLLAVLHTVFSRVDEKGGSAPLKCPDDALDRWENLWKLGSFPEKPIGDYLDKWTDRFWLFHPDRPFYQIPSASTGTEYPASKLIGELCESNNKKRLFSSRAADCKDYASYGEAARWLISVNAFDDASNKPTRGMNLPSTGVSWLGKLGLIYASGDNLFETLMLNLTLLESKDTMWGENKPCWELEAPRSGERTEIALPDNQAQLLTLQSRRTMLTRENGVVTGYVLMGGDFFPEANALSEQLTVWGNSTGANGNADFLPRRHDSAKQMWRDYASMFIPREGGRRPGVVRWIDLLRKAEILKKKKNISFLVASVKYDSKNCSITNVFGDSLTFHTDLITDLGRQWQARIEDEINRCDRLAYETGRLAGSLCKAAGGEPEAATDEAKHQLYHAIDTPFRSWLSSLDPGDDGETVELRVVQWRDTAKALAKKQGRELVDSAGPSAFTGRYITEKIKGKEEKRHYSSPEAYKWFQINLNKIYET